jgi:hypothetical protein
VTSKKLSVAAPATSPKQIVGEQVQNCKLTAEKLCRMSKDHPNATSGRGFTG